LLTFQVNDAGSISFSAQNVHHSPVSCRSSMLITSLVN